MASNNRLIVFILIGVAAVASIAAIILLIITLTSMSGRTKEAECNRDTETKTYTVMGWSDVMEESTTRLNNTGKVNKKAIYDQV